LFVPYYLFQQSAPATIEELARACEPSLKELLGEAETGQLQLNLFEASAKKEAEDLFAQTLQKAGLSQAPAEIEDVMRQSVQLLDYAVKSGMPDFSHVFQPLLRPLDDYSIRILEKRLKPRIPASSYDRRDYFYPYSDSLMNREKNLIEKNGRYLEQNFVYGRSIQKLGLLLFCLDYASQGGWGIAGIWRDVEREFSGKEMAALFQDLEKVNEFRNTRVAHVETRLTDANEAWDALYLWLKLLDQMARLV
jgi:type III restriction enzyme